jgi:uncharacterized membrane protein
MGDLEKEKDNTKDHYEYDHTHDNEKIDSTDAGNIKDKIVRKIFSKTVGKPEKDNVSLSESARISNNIRTILLSLFTLIGFIILVFAIFTANVSVELAQIATSVFMAAFIAAIVGAFTLFGVVVYQMRGESKAK